MQLAQRGARLIRLPGSAEELWRTVDAWLTIRGAERRPQPVPPPVLVEAGEPPPPSFTATELARLREVPSAVECECPNHLSGIVASLQAFERYSRECEVEHPDAAEVHATLARGTGRARALMEQRLRYLCEHDGIRI